MYSSSNCLRIRLPSFYYIYVKLDAKLYLRAPGISDLITKTVKGGGSNSVLLLGPRGVGKSLLVNLVLQKAREEIVFFRKDGLTVKLHGLLETDDKLALKQIARQLKLENVEGKRASISRHTMACFEDSFPKTQARNLAPAGTILVRF